GAECKLKLFAFHGFTPSRYPRHYNINTSRLLESLKPMKRYPMFDPPEYVDWTPDPSLLEEYIETIQRDRQRFNIVSRLKRDQLLAMYAGLLRFRLRDITLRRWVRQGILS